MRRFSSRRPSALLLAAAFVALAAQGADIWHLLVVPHTRCLEHGELVDAPAHAKTAVSVAITGISPAVPKLEHQHEHCAIAALQNKRLAAAPAITPAPISVLAEAPGTAPPFTHAFSLPILSYAPKNSPPLV